MSHLRLRIQFVLSPSPIASSLPRQSQRFHLRNHETPSDYRYPSLVSLPSLHSVASLRWDNTNDKLHDGCDDWWSCYWYYLCAVYGLIGVTALIQLIRIQLRVPEYGWTTQKVFHLLNFIICLFRALTFGLYDHLDDLEREIHSKTVQFFIFDIASLLFFTTYTLLVLFWAEIYHQALNEETHRLRPFFIGINVIVYVVQVVLWLMTTTHAKREVARYVSAGWLTAVFASAVIGFLVYGVRLFYMLSKFPIDSHGRKRKLQEVGVIALACSFCFLTRAALMFMFILDHENFDVDLMSDGLLNIVFYSVCEILPSILVLIILRKLPPKRSKSMSAVYTTIDEPQDY